MWLRVVWYIFTISGEHSLAISCPKVEGRTLNWKAVNYLPVCTWSHTRSHRPEALKSHTDAWRAEASVSGPPRHGQFHPLLQIIMKFVVRRLEADCILLMNMLIDSWHAALPKLYWRRQNSCATDPKPASFLKVPSCNSRRNESITCFSSSSSSTS
jgi:hypothetical protein